MPMITVNIETEQMAEKVAWLLEHFKNDGVEIVAREDVDDLKRLKATRGEDTTSLEEYLDNES